MPAPTSDRVVVPPQSGGVVRASAGSQIVVTDLEGAQIGDMWAFNAADPAEYLSAGQTRLALERMFPRAGEAFHTNRMRPILGLVEDRTPGLHDMLCEACNPAFYDALDMGPDHPSCAANFERVTGELGIDLGFVPQPVNLFQNTPVLHDGSIDYRTPATQPGDAIVFEALMDLIFVVTACSFDERGVNGDQCTSLALDVLDGKAS